MSRVSAEGLHALREVLEETHLLFQRARTAAGQVYRGKRLTGGMRGVLLDLDRDGPRTVPRLARLRSVSRQHIQILVDDLVRGGLVVMRVNPAHRISRLAAITPRGRTLVRDLKRLERRLLTRLPVALPGGELRRAAVVLREIRRGFESDRRPIRPTPSDL